MLKDCEFFVITTNVDHQFQLADFPKKQLFYTQGDYGLWQCCEPCHFKTYDNHQFVRQMIEAQGFHIGDDGTLELGVGENTPSIIKYPFWHAMHSNVRATYSCINMGGTYTPAGIRKRSILLNEDIDRTLADLLNAIEMEP